MKAWVAKDCDNDIYLMNRHPTKEYETWIDGGFINAKRIANKESNVAKVEVQEVKVTIEIE